MIECPDCNASFSGSRCKCGYVVKHTVAYFAGARDRPEEVLTQLSRDWLLSHGVHKEGMTRDERRAANLAYINRLKLSTPTAQAEPRAWAKQIKSNYIDGVCLLPIQISMASDALVEDWKDGVCNYRGMA